METEALLVLIGYVGGIGSYWAFIRWWPRRVKHEDRDAGSERYQQYKRRTRPH